MKNDGNMFPRHLLLFFVKAKPRECKITAKRLNPLPNRTGQLPVVLPGCPEPLMGMRIIFRTYQSIDRHVRVCRRSVELFPP